jgi:hypothetical protein
VTDVTADPTSGDCKKPGCDAGGNLIDVDDSADAPMDDNNPCTSEGCNGGTPINYVPVADDTPCGDAATCESNGTEYIQTSGETCQDGVCAAALTGSCGLYKCNGAQCFQTCGGNAECVSGTYCNAGSCVPQAGLGTPCMLDGQCGSDQCADGFCCNVDCSGLCQSCALSGQLGVCGSIPAGTDPGSECAGTQVCNGGGECKKTAGDTCMSDLDCLGGQCEDGVCCASDCSGDCKRCDVAGSVGTCQNVAAGQTSGACGGGSACNGTGACKKVSGQSCSTAAECLSGFCPVETGQDVCCNSACNGQCVSCKGAYTGGTDGTCGNITSKTDPDDECPGRCEPGSGNSCCDGNGMCD